MRGNRSAVEVALMVWLGAGVAFGVALVLLDTPGASGGWAVLVGAVPAAVAFLAAGGLDPPTDDDPAHSGADH